ncbi:hypothetical protein MAP00_001894 [Monascus purpureus]|nr:hypothetical protein MAP00_001894 [Monascus purpureus]
MTWSANTDIPVLQIIRYGASEANVIWHGFMLLEKAPGVSVDTIYDDLSADSKRSLVDRLTEFLIQLHAKPYSLGYVGALRLIQIVKINVSFPALP